MEHPSVKDKKRFRALRALCAAALLCLALGGASALAGLPAFAVGEEGSASGGALAVRIEGERFTYTGDTTAAAGEDYVLTLEAEDYYTISQADISVSAESISGGNVGETEAIAGWTLEESASGSLELTVPAASLDALDAATQLLVISVQPYYAQPLLTVGLPSDGDAQVTVQVGEEEAQLYTAGGVRFEAGQELTVTVASQNYYIENAADLGFTFDLDTWTYTWTQTAAAEDISLTPVYVERTQAEAPAEDAFTATPVIGEGGHVQRGGIALAEDAGIDAGALEYREQGASAYTSFPAAGIAGLTAAGTYEVRFAATETHFASGPVQIAVEQQYVVTLSAPAGTAGLDSTSAYVVAGEAYTLPAVTLTGYTFSGWYMQSGSEGSYTYTSVGGGGASYTPRGDVTLYARWALNAPALDAGEDFSCTYGDARTLTASATLETAAGKVTPSYVWTRGETTWNTASITDEELLSVATYTYTCTVTMTTDLAREYCADDTSSATDSVTVTVGQRDIAEVAVSGLQKSYTYTGAAQTPDFTLCFGGEDLKKDTEYTVTYGTNNVNATAEGEVVNITVTAVDGSNYKNSRTLTFTIVQKDIGSGVSFVASDKTYTGSTIELTDADIAATYTAQGGKVNDLVLGTDYDISYEGDRVNVTKAGITLTVTGKGNYKGSTTVTFKILAKSIDAGQEDVTFEEIANQTYTGSAIMLQGKDIAAAYYIDEVKVEDLVPDTDFTITGYANNINAGDATVTVTGTGNYTGERTIEFTIDPKSIAADAADLVSASVVGTFTYTGAAITLGGNNFTLQYNDKGLTLDTDFTIAGYANNTNAGSASVTVTGKGNYTGELELTFTIAPVTIGSLSFYEWEDPIYTGKEAVPVFSVFLGGKEVELKAGTDFDIHYMPAEDAEAAGFSNAATDHVNATEEGKAIYFTLEGKGNFTGTTSTQYIIGVATDVAVRYSPEFIIQPKSIAAGQTDVSFVASDKTYTGSTIELADADITATYTVKDVKVNDLVLGKDYDISYEGERVDVTEAGITLTITGKGNYTGSTTATFHILAKSIAAGQTDVSFGTIANQTYTGSAIELENDDIMATYTVKDVKVNTLVLDTDFTITGYADNENAGTASVTVEGKGNYSGTRTIEFTIGKKNIADSDVKFTIAPQTYTGSAITLDSDDISAAYLANTLSLDTHFTITGYADNTDAEQKSGKQASVTVAAANANYTGSVTLTFAIGQRDIAEVAVSGLQKSYTYTGAAQTPDFTLRFGGEDLEKDTEYTVTYGTNNVNATAEGEVVNITVTAVDGSNYKSSRTLTFTIERKDIGSGVSFDAADQTYTGSAIALENDDITATYTAESGKVNTLVLNTDYTIVLLEGVDYINVTGAAVSFTVRGTGNYTGSRTLTFTIVQKDIGSGVSFVAFDKTYTGSVIELADADIAATYTVGQQVNDLVLGKDYDISYEGERTDVTAAGITLTITGIGNYKGSTTATFHILAKSIAAGQTDVSFGTIADQTYTGSAIALEDDDIAATYSVAGVKDNDLVLGTDYTIVLLEGVDYTNVTGAAVSFTVRGTGNYTGERTLTFTIVQKDIGSGVRFEVDDFTYTGGTIELADADIAATYTVEGVKDNDLVLGKDYDISYEGERVDVTEAGITLTITGKGNYTGKTTATFHILAKSIAAGQTDVSFGTIADQTYTGSAIALEDDDIAATYTVKDVKVNTLKLGTDYIVEYAESVNYTDVTGAAVSFTVRGTGNYTGSRTLTFTIVQKDIGSGVSFDAADQTYTGSVIELQNGDVTALYVVGEIENVLVLGTDYTIEYAGERTDVTAAGITLTITGIGNYKGSTTVTFKILAKSIDAGQADVSFGKIADQTYTGSAIALQDDDIAATYSVAGVKDNDLVLGTDYTIVLLEGVDYINVSGAAVSFTVRGTGNYTGERTLTFTIAPRALEDGFIAAIADQTYTGEAQTPSLTLTYNNMTLVLGENADYTAVYGNNTDATRKSGSPATVTVTGHGNYTGTASATFTILPRALEDGFIAAIADQTYTGEAQTPSLTLTYNGRALVLGEDADYTAVYGNNTDATRKSGSPATVTVTGHGNYDGSASATFTILPRALEDEFIAAIDAETYTGEAHTPSLTVTYNGMTLSEGDDYTAAYADNIDAGTATVTLTGTGNYTGSASAAFTIDPRTIDSSFTFVIAEGEIVGFLKNTAAGEYDTDEIAVDIAMGSLPLVEDRDFTVVWRADGAPLAADTALFAQSITVAVTGEGNYAGTYILEGEGSQLHIWAVRVSAGGEDSYFDAADEALASLGGGEYTVALYEDAAAPVVLGADASVTFDLRGYDLAGVTVEAGSLTLLTAQESALGPVDVRAGGSLSLEGSFAAGAVDAQGGLTVAGALSADTFRSTGSLAVAAGGTLAAQSLSFEGGTAEAAGTLAGSVSLSGASLLINGYIDGSVTLTAGTLSLEGGVSGSVLVTGGALAVMGGSVAGGAEVTGGTLTASGASQIGALSVSGGAATLGGSLTVTAAGDAVTYTGGSLTISPGLDANFACGGADVYVAPGCTISASGYAGEPIAVTTETGYCGTFAIAEGSTAFALQAGREDLLLVPEGGGVALYSLEQVALSMPETSGAAVVYEGTAYRGGDAFTAPYGSDLSLELLPDAGYILAGVAVTEGASLTQEGENFERVAIGGLVSDVTLTVSVLRIAEDFFLYTPPAEPVYGISGEQLVLGGSIQPTQDALAAVWNTVSVRWYIGTDGAYTELIDLRPTDLNAQTPYTVYVTFAGDNIGDTGYIYAGSFELLPLTITADDFLPVDATWIYVEGGTPTEVDAVEIVPTGEKAALMEEDGLVSDLSVYFAGNGVAISDGWSQPADFVGEYAGEYIVCLMLLGDSVNAVNYLPDGVQVAYTVFIEAGTLHVNLPQVDNDNVSVEGGSGIPDGVTVRSSAVLEGSTAFWTLESDTDTLAAAAGFDGGANIEYVYDIRLVVEETGEEYVESTGSSYTIRIEIPEPLLGTEFSILHIHGDAVDELDYTVEGRQAIIRVQDFSYFVFVTPELSLYLPIFVELAVAAALLALVIATAVRRRRYIKKEEALLAAVSFAAFSNYPAGQLYALLGLGAFIVVLILVELWLLLDMRRRKKIAAEEARRAERRAKRAAADPLRRFIRTDIRREDITRPEGPMAGFGGRPAPNAPAPNAPAPESAADAERPSIYALARSGGKTPPRSDR